jgi:hypothetical protein
MNITELDGVLTKDQLMDQVSEYEAAEPVEITLGEKVGFNIDGEGVTRLVHPKGETSLSSAALGNLLAYIGFPRAYLKKIPKEEATQLVIPHLNYWYGNELAGGILRLLTIENTAIMAIPKANFKHVKISEVVNAAESVLGKSVAGYHKPWFSPTAFHFSVLTPREVEIAKEQVFNAGIRVAHSITGEVSTNVAPYLFNQWCTNGATTEHEIRAWKRRNQKEDIGVWLQRTITEASKYFDKEVDSLRELCGIKVKKETSQILDSVLEQSMVPRGLQKEVRNTLIDDGAEDLFDLYNIFTKVDTHSNFDDHPNSKGILDRVAAHLANHSKLCPVCHKQMNGD